jgi:hypothetical protein
MLPHPETLPASPELTSDDESDPSKSHLTTGWLFARLTIELDLRNLTMQTSAITPAALRDAINTVIFNDTENFSTPAEVKAVAEAMQEPSNLKAIDTLLAQLVITTGVDKISIVPYALVQVGILLGIQMASRAVANAIDRTESHFSFNDPYAAE